MYCCYEFWFNKKSINIWHYYCLCKHLFYHDETFDCFHFHLYKFFIFFKYFYLKLTYCNKFLTVFIFAQIRLSLLYINHEIK